MNIVADKMRGVRTASLICIAERQKPRCLYNPDICTRKAIFDNLDGPIDRDSINAALLDLEHALLLTDLTPCEVRIIICLSIYSGLTHMELQNLTGMKQSAVSRTVSRLTKRGLVYSRIGKKYEVGRPYQLVSVAFSFNDVVKFVSQHVDSCRSGLDYLSSLDNGRELDVGDVPGNQVEAKG